MSNQTKVPYGNANINKAKRCETCAFTHRRQRRYEHARLRRLESPPR